ncbi:MAG: CDGSH iron-sulfur domain-containing protein [Dysgonamonadaceae bacterium]|nr:CDGSH iron-sulfur domain-containing protein [Dysgonamonadaceae bacterium]MDD3310385.1 CDGSH iron-sulfur domain-containing protein [Dysgonamonadaceae bacterium]MDD3900029.1 CDGSH iron-sulfur domain-containing protein [Dysgonamonadaceae bacterium]MDD4398779.1 CDGSH iron-sulfur domain-containing protein [Dysgonamonadaceae bacterium]
MDSLLEVKLFKNGPIHMEGKFNIVLPDGTNEVKEGTIHLCRCGSSKNKPFCDGTHAKVGFEG